SSPAAAAAPGRRCPSAPASRPPLQAPSAVATLRHLPRKRGRTTSASIPDQTLHPPPFTGEVSAQRTEGACRRNERRGTNPPPFTGEVPSAARLTGASPNRIAEGPIPV